MVSENRLRLQLYGLVFLVVLALVAAFAVAMFNGAFARGLSVTVAADRAGLLMNTGADVKIRNVVVGKVQRISISADGGAELALDLEPEMVGAIPANVTAALESSTIFGPKSVRLVLPDQPTADSISEGAVIERATLPTELNTVFENLDSVLTSIQPAKLNATLGALATALEGRGDELGRLAVELDAYLGGFNPSLPALQRDLAATGPVLETYADVSPDVLRLLENLTVTSDTVVQERHALDTLLAEFTGLSDTSREVLADNEVNLVTALDLLQPTAALLAEYAPVLPCFLQGTAEVNERMERANGGNRPGLSMLSTFLPGQEPYKYPRDLPRVAADNPPDCHGLPEFVDDDPVAADHVQFDDGSTSFAPGSTDDLEVGRPPLALLLFGPDAALTGGDDE